MLDEVEHRNLHIQKSQAMEYLRIPTAPSDEVQHRNSRNLKVHAVVELRNRWELRNFHKASPLAACCILLEKARTALKEVVRRTEARMTAVFVRRRVQRKE